MWGVEFRYCEHLPSPHFPLCPSLCSEPLKPCLPVRVTVGWFFVGGRGQQQVTCLAGELRRAMLLLLAWKIQGSLSPVHPSPSMQSKEPPPLPRVLLGTPGPVQSLLFPGANWVVTTGAGGSWLSWMQVVELRAERGPPVHARRYALRCGPS